MHVVYLISVWLHILAATAWIGGMFFLVIVIVPLLRAMERSQAASLMHAAGVRFRGLGWACFAVLLASGTYNLWFRGVRLGDFARPEFLGSPFGHALVIKLALFAGVLAISVWHDFFVGPRATQVGRTNPGGDEAQRLRKLASYAGRLNVLLALAIVALAVTLVRGMPF